MNITCLPNNPAAKRYAARFAPTMAVYVIAIIAAALVFKHHPPHGVLAYLLAVLPAIPIIGMIVIVGLYLKEETDEFQRTVLIQSMLWAVGATLAVTTVWGFLELFSLAPHFDTYLAFPLFWFCVGVTTPFLKRKYR